MSIVTKRGDDGSTSLRHGQRVPKSHPRVWAYGTVDELNSAFGMARAALNEGELRDLIQQIQSSLICLMAELAVDDDAQASFLKNNPGSLLSEDHLEALDEYVRKEEGRGGIFNGWVLAGENEVQARLDVCRTSCRRAERYTVELAESGGQVRPALLQYLNRLSDVIWLMGNAE